MITYKQLVEIGNFPEFTTLVHLDTQMNWLDVEVKRSKVSFAVRQRMIK